MSISDVFTKIAAALKGNGTQMEERPAHQESPWTFKEELERIREAYKEHPYKEKGLSRPFWMAGDELSVLYDECDTLFENGEIYYGYIVQANDMLFKDSPKADCPANLIYSQDPMVNANPAILQELARKLFEYKGKPMKEVPEELKGIVGSLKGEQSRQPFELHMKFGEDQDVVIKFITIMIFRKYLPGNKLIGSFLPVIAYPEKCKSTMILPKECWTESFTNAYWY